MNIFYHIDIEKTRTLVIALFNILYTDKVIRLYFAFGIRLLNDLIDIEYKMKQIKQKLIDNYNNYPERLLKILLNNSDTVDFIKDYPNKKNNTYSNNIGKVSKGVIPLLLKWEQKWRYSKYGNSIIAISGYWPTTLSVVITSLTKDNTRTPYEVAKFAEKKRHYTEYGRVGI